MDLLKAMLEKDPRDRISAKDALSHPAFNSVMSKSPLIMRQLFNSDALLRHTKLVEQWANQQEPQGRREGGGRHQDPRPHRGPLPPPDPPHQGPRRRVEPLAHAEQAQVRAVTG